MTYKIENLLNGTIELNCENDYGFDVFYGEKIKLKEKSDEAFDALQKGVNCGLINPNNYFKAIYRNVAGVRSFKLHIYDDILGNDSSLLSTFAYVCNPWSGYGGLAGWVDTSDKNIKPNVYSEQNIEKLFKKLVSISADKFI